MILKCGKKTLSPYGKPSGVVVKGLAKVTADSTADAEFLTQTRNSLPSLRINLEKLLNHYKINMPKINTGLASFRVWLEKLESKPLGATNMFGDLAFEEGSGTNPSPELVEMKEKFESSITEVKSTVEALGDVVHASGSRKTRHDLDDVVVEFADQLGDLEVRTSGEGFASGDHIFNSKALVSKYLSSEKVPNAGCFWDLFSGLACMSPKRQWGKEKADETYSAKQINPPSWTMICWRL
jgi:hypothetical protein